MIHGLFVCLVITATVVALSVIGAAVARAAGIVVTNAIAGALADDDMPTADVAVALTLEPPSQPCLTAGPDPLYDWAEAGL